MFEVELSKEEIIACRTIGNMRTLISRAGGIVDRQMGKQDALEIDEDGVIGEYAFCKHHNIFFDPVAKIRGGSYDCMLKGQRIDVKTTRYAEGKLLATMKKNDDVDVYVLAILSGNVVRFPGYATARELRREDRIMNLGHGDGYGMTQDQLTKWKDVN